MDVRHHRWQAAPFLDGQVTGDLHQTLNLWKVKKKMCQEKMSKQTQLYNTSIHGLSEVKTTKKNYINTLRQPPICGEVRGHKITAEKKVSASFKFAY